MPIQLLALPILYHPLKESHPLAAKNLDPFARRNVSISLDTIQPIRLVC